MFDEAIQLTARRIHQRPHLLVRDARLQRAAQQFLKDLIFSGSIRAGTQKRGQRQISSSQILFN